MRRHIALSVTFQATVIGGDEYIPDSTAAEESVVITLPMIDPKFAVFPKILEGVTLSVMETLKDNVRSYLSKREAEEKRRKEYEQMGLKYSRTNGFAPVAEGASESADDDEEEGDEGDEGGDLDQVDDDNDSEENDELATADVPF